MHEDPNQTAGNRKADVHFLRLFVRHEQALRTYARVMVPTWDAVDEVIQEASVVMWRKFDQLDAHGNFLPWAKVIVRFESLRNRRKFARDRLVFSEDLLAMLADQSVDVGDEAMVVERVVLTRCLAATARVLPVGGAHRRHAA